MRQGYDCKQLELISSHVTIPVVASGGAGHTDHFIDVFKKTQVSAALAASVFHSKEIRIRELKSMLYEAGIPMRRVYEK